MEQITYCVDANCGNIQYRHGGDPKSNSNLYNTVNLVYVYVKLENKLLAFLIGKLEMFHFWKHLERFNLEAVVKLET